MLSVPFRRDKYCPFDPFPWFLCHALNTYSVTPFLMPFFFEYFFSFRGEEILNIKQTKRYLPHQIGKVRNQPIGVARISFFWVCHENRIMHKDHVIGCIYNSIYI